MFALTKRPKRLFWMLVFLALLGLIGYRIVFSRPENGEVSISRIRSERGLPVTVLSVKRDLWELRQSYYGQIRSIRIQNVTAYIREFVEDVHVDVGDAVTEGQILIELSRKDRETELRARQTRHDNLSSLFRRAETVYRAGGLSKRDLEEIETRLRDAASLLRSSRSELERTRIYSRMNGTVLRRDIEIGEIAEPGTPLLTIADTDNLEIEILIPSEIFPQIHLGTEVYIPETIYNAPIRAYVRRIDPEADRKTGLFRIIAVLPFQSGLLPGSFVQTEIVLDRRDGVISLPYEAIRQDGTTSYVFVVSGDRSIRRPIRLGKASEGRVEVRAGLQPEERVVFEGLESLFDGARIWIQETIGDSGKER